MSCSFGQKCQSIPRWPMLDRSNATKVHATIVLKSLSYLNDWYTSALAQFDFVPTLVQDYGSQIFDQLKPPNSTAGAKGIAETAVFNLLGTAVSLVPNPYATSAVGALRFMGLLFQSPASSPIAPLIPVEQLRFLLSDTDGRLYAAASNSLSARWQTLFKSGAYVKASNGILAVLASGVWFDWNQNQRLASPATAQLVERLTYQWLVSQSMQLYRVFLHAVALSENSYRAEYNMPGQTIVKFENYTFNVWPAIWDPSPSTPSPKGHTQYTPGQILYSSLVDERDTAIDATDLFVQSLDCQLQQRNRTVECDGNGLNCRLSTDSTVLNPWPSPATSAIYSQTTGACLFNLPIVLDNSQSNLPNFHFPDNEGTMSGVASANEECPTGGLWENWTDPLSNGVVVFVGNQLGVCQTQWS